MARRISSSTGRSSSSGFRASPRSSFTSNRSAFRNSTFRPSSTRYLGGYRYRSNPYRRNYFFHSLGVTGKTVYSAIVAIFILGLIFLTIFY